MPAPASTSEFPAPCRHCSRLLHGAVRFCPYCGGEETARLQAHIGAVNATSTATTTTAATATATTTATASAPAADDTGPERWAPEPTEAVPQLAMDAPLAPRRDQQPQQPGLPSILGPSKPPREGTDADPNLLGPAAFEWPEGLPAVIEVEPRPARPRIGTLLTKPVAIATALGLSVLAVVLSLGPLQASREAEPGMPQASVAAKLEQAQGTLRRGDLDSAQRQLGALSAAYPGHAGVQALQEELDQREREQAARREQLREAAGKAAQALGIREASPSTSTSTSTSTSHAAMPAEAPARTTATTNVTVAAPPAVAAQEPKSPACSGAMAALALCASEADGAQQAPSR